jgi:hypothetical protein
MHDEQLDDLLHRLPHEPARADFTSRVLGRLSRDERPAATLRGRAVPAFAFGVIAVTAIAAGLLLAPVHYPQSESPSAKATAEGGPVSRVAAPPMDRAALRRELGELKTEGAALERELSEMHHTPEPPVIYLGGDESLDMVIHPNRVPVARRAGRRGGSPM